MANPSFTRDEAILALDTLLFSGDSELTTDSQALKELCEILKTLPVHDGKKCGADFRSCTGVLTQLKRFQASCNSGKQGEHIGTTFFEVAFEFEDHLDELHKIANSIRKNLDGFNSCYGAPLEDRGFPEGILLGHLHSLIESRDGAKVPLKDRCEICSSSPMLYYKQCGPLLQRHLLVPPTEMDYKRKYGAEWFITVCPNCHEALHRFRPWLTKENRGDLLR